MKIITKYQADDGSEFRDERTCLAHESECRRVEGANVLLQSGASLAECLTVAGHPPHESQRAALEQITKDTALIISYWQCRDQPGYKPCRIELQGRIFVHGDAGSWSGPYGGTMSPRRLIGYWENTTRAMAPRVAP